MITDKVVAAVADYLETFAPTALATATFYERDEGADFEYPAVIVAESGPPEEHEIRRGHWTVDLEVMLKTKPEGDEAASTHRTMTDEINALIGDTDGTVAHLGKTLECNDSWGGTGGTENEDGFRVTTFSLEIKAALS